jgi:ubiquinone/menaquinone biosynthesis C-methylase UbiE
MNDAPNADRIYGRFGRLSAAYDAARREIPSETVTYVASQLSRAHPFVLDLACGTGISTRQLAGIGVRVVGCDIDPRMVRYATGRGGAGLGYVIGRAEAIPFRDGTFDAVACFRAYHWFDPARALPEMMRVLRPDGRIAIANMKGRDALYNDYRKLVAQFVNAELPDHRKTYDPKRDLAAHGLKVVAEHVEREIQTGTVLDMITQFQSVSVWNLIPEGRLEIALDALTEFCRSRATDGVISRELVYDTIIAAR